MTHSNNTYAICLDEHLSIQPIFNKTNEMMSMLFGVVI
jgi:hypothetical protein